VLSRHHLKTIGNEPNLIVVQCDSGDMNTNLIACARYCVHDELEKMDDSVSTVTHVVFIVQLPRNGRFPGFQVIILFATIYYMQHVV
jgi:hypothetical protein